MTTFKHTMTFKEFLEHFPKIEENYLNFTVDSVSFSNDNIVSFTVVGDIGKDKCKSYHTQKEKHYLTEYEKGYYVGLHHQTPPEYEIREIGICYETKDRESCNCDGDINKCNFKR